MSKLPDVKSSRLNLNKDVLKRVKMLARASFTKTLNSLNEQMVGVDSDGLSSVRSLLRVLQEKYKELQEFDKETFISLVEEGASDEETLKEMETSDDYRLKFYEAQTLLENLSLRSSKEADSPTFLIPGGSLVKPSINCFSGQPLEWLSFWSQFKGIHENSNLNDEEKLNHLIEATVPESEAREVILKFPATGSSYQKAVESLISEFGDKDLLTEAYVRQLLSILLGKLKFSSLSSLYENIQTQIQALSTLGATSDKNAVMLYPLVESCFPEYIIKVWQRVKETESTNSTTDQTRLARLLDFIKREAEAQRRASITNQDEETSSDQTSTGKKKKKKNKKAENNETSSDVIDATNTDKVYDREIVMHLKNSPFSKLPLNFPPAVLRSSIIHDKPPKGVKKPTVPMPTLNANPPLWRAPLVLNQPSGSSLESKNGPS